MASDRAVTRRRYDDELKAQVVAECDAAGASVAKVAMSHGINANVVHRWRQLAREARAPVSTPTPTPTPPSEFVAVSLAPSPVAAPVRDIQVQLRRGATAMTITWPVSASAEFAGWMRELLR
jgi:transposase